MKRKSIIFVVIALMLLCVCSLSACHKNNENVTVFTYEDADKYSTDQTEFSDYVSELDINWVSGSVKITTGNVRSITVEEKYSKEKVSDAYKVHTFLDNGKLHVAFAKSGKFVGFINLKKDLVVTFPQEMDLKTVRIRSVSAPVELDNSLTVTDFRVETISGEVKAQFSAESPVNFKVETVSGKVSATFERKAAPFIDIETVSAEAHVTALDLSDVDFESVSGSLLINIPEGVGYVAELRSVSGKFSSEYDEKTTYGDGKVKIDAETTTGNLTIKKA
ncbi:MAG: DUF4097 family beta strand repeat protein [Clostridia bacterium]|nr:DUF4097 family beta strand repeat protein [Clostridia bacterium]